MSTTTTTTAPAAGAAPAPAPAPAADTITFTLNDVELTVKKGTTVMEAASRNNIYIPHFCWHPGLSIAGVAFYAEMVADYVAAIVLGILFQYLAISAMRPLSRRHALALAAKADALSLTSFELGLFAWMALMNFVFFPAPHHLHPTSPVYWFLMQVGMIAGFFTAWPANTWLIRRGIKEAMT